METARRVSDLARELGVQDVAAVLNKIRNPADREAVTAYCGAHGLTIAGEIPYDDQLAEAERAGQPPLDYQPDSPSMRAIRQLALSLATP
jgi:CO dehydrogenase nickel-insertion accessory protein CooC1